MATTSHILESLAPSDALWVYQAERNLDEDEKKLLTSTLSSLCSEWMAHGEPVAGVYEIIYDRFILVAAPDPEGFVSGCSNDLLNRAIKSAEEKLKLSLVTPELILWRDESTEIRCNTREEFEELVHRTEINGDTIVFNTNLSRVGQFQDGMLECQARDSWHSRVFGLY